MPFLGPPFDSYIGAFVIGRSPIGGYVFSMDSPGITQTINAYLYWQYSDDDALQAFVAAENAMNQAFLDWFNTINLPVYTSPTIGGPLLDWIGSGLYGMPRPVIRSFSTPRFIGPYGTVMFGTVLRYGALKDVHPSVGYVTSDDIYKRVLTWHFFKGDGKYFNARWLKRRVMRFLIGTNGTAPRIDFTPQISLSVAGGVATITILQTKRVAVGGTVFGEFFFGAPVPYGSVRSRAVTVGQPFANAGVFQAAVESGALELPFQYQWNIIIQG